MSFASLSEFFRMGTHGVYVWTAYGLTLAALIAIHVYVCRRQRRLRLHPRPHQAVGSTSGNPSVLRGKQPRLQRRHLLFRNLNPKWHRSQPQNPNLFQRPSPWWSNSLSRNQNQHRNPNPNPRSPPRLLPSRSVRSGQPCARRLGARIRLPRLCSPKPGCWACATARWSSGTTLAPWPLG